MSRFLRRAAFTAAAGGLLYAAAKVIPPEPSPLSVPSSSSTPSTTPAVTGHVALVRAHPDLRDLNALLTPRSFLIDATQALLASALRCPPYSPPQLRQRLDAVSIQIQSAEAKGDAGEANGKRIQLALHDARDGRLEDALGACARVAFEQPNYDYALVPRLIAAVLCSMLVRPDEEARWIEGVALRDRSGHVVNGLQAVVVLGATLGGCAPRAAGSDKQVRGTMLWLAEMAMWSIFNDAGLRERVEVLALILFLRRLAAMDLRNVAADTSQGTTPS